jgi:hypothetical protein
MIRTKLVSDKRANDLLRKKWLKTDIIRKRGEEWGPPPTC